MEMYRLKKEAVPFFSEKIATKIMDLSTWEENHVDINALEKVEPVRVEYGHVKEGRNYASLGGWSADEGTHFHFTIHFPSVKFMEHDNFGNGKMVRELMDKIQRVVNSHYQDFVNSDDK